MLQEGHVSVVMQVTHWSSSLSTHRRILSTGASIGGKNSNQLMQVLNWVIVFVTPRLQRRRQYSPSPAHAQCHMSLAQFPVLWARDKNLGKGYNYLSDDYVFPWGGLSFNFCPLHQWLEKNLLPYTFCTTNAKGIKERENITCWGFPLRGCGQAKAP